ncbi:hypothetical protein P7K49_025099 [Saguinus oedipus]|uniref:Uncharacterized protein n=1 Tax=Saguinus oedipus TaxID=9490 RepID=A0ABQ9UGA1_SAGOE|nr:hypothetical protein P7K49_025099 [Saguinus oedipus]
MAGVEQLLLQEKRCKSGLYKSQVLIQEWQMWWRTGRSHSSVPGPHQRLWKTPLSLPEKGWGVFQGAEALWVAECLRGTEYPSGVPVLPWGACRAPADPLLSLRQGGWSRCRLVLGARLQCPSFLSLLDGVFNGPPMTCAAAKDEVDASQSPVLHLQAAPCALVHDGSILEGDKIKNRGGERAGKREGEREGKREGEIEEKDRRENEKEKKEKKRETE